MPPRNWHPSVNEPRLLYFFFLTSLTFLTPPPTLLFLFFFRCASISICENVLVHLEILNSHSFFYLFNFLFLFYFKINSIFILHLKILISKQWALILACLRKEYYFKSLIDGCFWHDGTSVFISSYFKKTINYSGSLKILRIFLNFYKN